MEAQSLPRPGGLALPRSPRLLAPLSDARLVEQVRRGNDVAFEAIFDRHHRAILSFCRHMLGSPDEAEDAVQQTFVSAYDAMRGDARELKLKAWLYAIARNKCLSILRGRRERPSELDDVPTVGLADEVQHRADLRELLRDMRELPEDQRAALVLSELGDLSHAEIGTVVGCDPVKVKSLVFQARSSLIENRNARETPCIDIREQLATARGGALRRGPLRKHLKTCVGCRAFREDVTRQRAMAALVLPVVPSVGLKSGALAALGIGGGGAGIAAGGTAIGAGLGAGAVGTGAGAGTVATVGGLKLAAAVVATVAAVGGGFAVSEVARSGDPSQDAPVSSSARDATMLPGSRSAAGAAVGLPLAEQRRSAAADGSLAGRHGPSSGDTVRSVTAQERLAGKQSGSTKSEHGSSRPEHAGTKKPAQTRTTHTTAPQRGTNAGARTGQGADSRGSKPAQDRTPSSTTPPDERKPAHGPRAADQPSAMPDVTSAVPATPPLTPGRGASPTGL